MRRKREPGDPEFGRALPCDCAKRESEGKRQARLQRYSHLGRLAQVTFEQLDLKRAATFEHAASAARAFARRDDEESHWLLLWGRAGSGKTALGAAMANDRIARGQPALYMVAPDLLDHLRAAYKADAGIPYPALFEQVRNAPFLILDDLDASNLTAWADEKLFQLLNHRENSGLPTVVLCSKAPDALEGTMGSLLGRIPRVQQFRVDGEMEPSSGAGAYRQIGGMTRDRLERFTFERFRVEGRGLTQEDADSLQLIRSVLRDWAQEPQGWITLMGPTGTGKTHLAAAIVLERLARGDGVFFAVVPDLLDYLRRTYSPDNPETYDEVLDALRGVDLLLLDDLGAHSTTPWAREKLYQLFSYRYLQSLPTIITTNVAPDDLDPRLASRLFDHQQNKVYEIDTRDYRTGTPARPIRDTAPKRRPSAWDTPRW